MITVIISCKDFIPMEESDFHQQRIERFKWTLEDCIDRLQIGKVNHLNIYYNYNPKTQRFELINTNSSQAQLSLDRAIKMYPKKLLEFIS